VPGPAFALLNADGSAVTGTDVFTQLIGMSVLSQPALVAAVTEISGGGSEHVSFTVSLPDGAQAGAQIEAVDRAQERLLLLEVSLPRPGGRPHELTNWLARFSDDSEAIVWLKDLDGHYLQVNRRYTDQLGPDPDRIRGRTDAELSQFEAIDGPRHKRAGGPEPVQLEYVIPAFDRRPAFTALRFAVTDAAGASVAVCGVASPADQADVANAECHRLLGVLRWLKGDPAGLRRTVLGQWAITAVQPPAGRAASPSAPTVPRAGRPDPSAPGQPQMPADLAPLLMSLQRQVSDLEIVVGRSTTDTSAISERAPTAPEAGALDREQRRLGIRVQRLEAELGELRAQVTELQAGLAASREPVTRLGWDEGARAALAEGLRGCLNVRSMFSEAVRLIGSAGGWDLVVAWLAQDDGRWGCAATWVRSPTGMAGVESAMWQLRLSPSASAVGAAAHGEGIVWLSDPTRSDDRHLAELGASGLATVVLAPVRRDGSTIAVLQFAGRGAVEPNPSAEAAFASIEDEVVTAHQRVTDTATASQWGRRSR
jgi:PAS domain-containing protein